MIQTGFAEKKKFMDVWKLFKKFKKQNTNFINIFLKFSLFSSENNFMYLKIS